MSKKVIITGATGSIGKNIAQILTSRGDQVIVFSQNPDKAKNTLPACSSYVKWSAYDPTGEWESSLNGVDAIIHLAGTSIFGELWSDSYKEKIFKSRVDGTKNLVNAISKTENKPKHFISASAIGYYGASKNDVFVEESKPGTGFLPKVSTNWEAEAIKIEQCGVKCARVRVGIVLDKDEGALKIIHNPFKNLFGGMIGDGSQWISWIHKRDAANIFIYILDNNLEGVFNAVSPNPVQMKEFSDVLSNKFGKMNLINVPKLPFEAMLGEASIPITEGIHVKPDRTIKEGYQFEFSDLQGALNNIF